MWIHSVFIFVVVCNFCYGNLKSEVLGKEGQEGDCKGQGRWKILKERSYGPPVINSWDLRGPRLAARCLAIIKQVGILAILVLAAFCYLINVQFNTRHKFSSLAPCCVPAAAKQFWIAEQETPFAMELDLEIPGFLFISSRCPLRSS